MKKLLLVVILLFAFAAHAKTYLLVGANGACMESPRGKVSMFFCAKYVEPDKTVYFIKVDILLFHIDFSTAGDIRKVFDSYGIPNNGDDYLILKNEDSKFEVKVNFDEIYFDEEKRKVFITYLWYVPEAFMKIFRKEVRSEFIFHVNNKNIVFSLDEDEKEELRFISMFQSMETIL